MDAKFLNAGDSAISVQLGNTISLEVNQQVRMLYQELQENPIEGVVETVPTYASLMVHYRPEKILYDELIMELKGRLHNMREPAMGTQIVREVPICYEGELAIDLEECARLDKVSVEELIRKHSEHEYYTYMLGFAPGHAYMARFDEPFKFKRRESPRIKIVARSIVVQENLSNFIPFEQPCGWNIIGTTPLEICDYSKEDPFLTHAGEWVKFIPVSRREYDKIRADVEKGTYKVTTYEKVVS